MARKAEKRGFGTIEKLPSGSYRARYVGPDLARHTAAHTFVARLDAEAWLLSERQLISSGEWTSPDERAQRALRQRQTRTQTFHDYAERWLEERRNSRGQPLAELTRDKYRTLLKVHIYPTFADRPLGSITRDDVRAWYANMAPGRPTAQAHAYNLFRSILHSAVVDDELLEKNPVYIRGAGVRHRSKQVVPATLDELAIIVEAMPEGRKLMILLATWCALRSGELRELRRSDIVLRRDERDEPFGWVRIRRGVVRARTGETERGKRTEPITRTPKTEAGVRDVSIPGFLLPQVREHLLRHTAPGKDGLLFPSSSGRHLADSTFNGRPAVLDRDGSIKLAGFGWREARRRAGRPDLDFHDLRHTGASMAGEAGASMAELMYRLGHSTPSMAMLYQHSRIERDRELGRRLSERAASGSADPRTSR